MNLRYRSPLKDARGLGSAKAGTSHFVLQRLTSVALIPLTIWFLVLVLSLLGSDYLTASDTVRKPWNEVLLVSFLIAMFWHAQLGVQVVLEDYVHHSLLALSAQVLVKFLSILGAIAGVFAVASIALGN